MLGDQQVNNPHIKIKKVPAAIGRDPFVRSIQVRKYDRLLRSLQCHAGNASRDVQAGIAFDANWLE